MFGYFEADDLTAAERHLAQRDISTRWQDAMAEQFPLLPEWAVPGLEPTTPAFLELLVA